LSLPGTWVLFEAGHGLSTPVADDIHHGHGRRNDSLNRITDRLSAEQPSRMSRPAARPAGAITREWQAVSGRCRWRAGFGPTCPGSGSCRWEDATVGDDRDTELSDAEALTLAVLQALLGNVSEARRLRFARAPTASPAPVLCQVSPATASGTASWLPVCCG
jgi:hypothetical protein